ncbi:MAG: VOC family protein [bacterium]
MEKIPDNTKIQSIDLRVRDIKTSLNFYSEMLGMIEFERTDNISYLSANGNLPYIIKLVEDKNATVRMQGTTGLFHLALRLPNRKELARVFLRLFNNDVKFQGFSDHLVSEAIYLTDPDGNGVELYADRPRELWEWKIGEVKMDTLPLDLSKITNELDDRDTWNGIHPDTDLGHIHLNVSDLFQAEKIFNDIVGFNVTNSSYPGAKFFSAGGYHHHIGTNTWQTRKGITRKENSLGMDSFTIKLPDKESLKSIQKNAQELGLLMDSNDQEVFIKDYDHNKLRLVN